MKKPDAVLRELGQLYDFQKELSKFRFRDRQKPSEDAAADRETKPLTPRSAVAGR